MLEFLPRIVFRVPTQLMRRFYLRLANHFTTKSLSGILKDISERFVIDGKIFLFAVDGQGIILQNIFALTMKLTPVSLSRRPLVDESMLKCRRSWVVVVC